MFLIVVWVGIFHHAGVFFCNQVPAVLLTGEGVGVVAEQHFVGPVFVLAAAHDGKGLMIVLTAGSAADIFNLLKHIPL